MKLKDIPYFIKFTFIGDEEDYNCYSLADRETLKFVKSKHSKESVSSLKTGDEIYFESDASDIKHYRITEILIQHIVDDTDSLKYGIDSEDCIEQGEPKEWLFKILVRMHKL